MWSLNFTPSLVFLYNTDAHKTKDELSFVTISPKLGNATAENDGKTRRNETNCTFLEERSESVRSRDSRKRCGIRNGSIVTVNFNRTRSDVLLLAFCFLVFVLVFTVYMNSSLLRNVTARIFLSSNIFLMANKAPAQLNVNKSLNAFTQLDQPGVHWWTTRSVVAFAFIHGCNSPRIPFSEIFN